MSSEHVSNPESPERPRKRKLRFPRTSNACNFCRRRKVRCTGTQPCEVCIREEVPCEYASSGPVNSASPQSVSIQRLIVSTPGLDDRSQGPKRTFDESNDVSRGPSSRAESAYNDTAPSRRASLEPPQTFVYGNHVGPTSGVSFLYGQWNKGQTQDEPKVNSGEGEAILSNAPLISYGDVAQLDYDTVSSLPEPESSFTIDQMLDILDRYFQHISPTYRFHHHPTVRRWAITYVSGDRKRLTYAQKACVLLICAQTLLHSPVGPSVIQVGQGDPRTSMACSERAKALLEKEPGPASLASVQARIALCLYLLSTFRLNECRYCFSFAVTVATALGIHRKLTSSAKTNVLEAESRKRTFWSLYTLDGYLSVMLGRPRLIRDEDIDQQYPRNIADNDLMSTEPAEDLPQHGNLEAAVAHAKLAKLMGRGNDLLYPLHSLTKDQLLQRSNEMLDALAEWQNALPDYLRPRARTMTGQRSFERQNTILKLANMHVRILATRRCLLMDFGHTTSNAFSQSEDGRAKRVVRECISAIIMILDTVQALIEHNQCYGSFWSTQYVALVAISTLYMLLIQGVRHALPGDVESFLNVDESLEKARCCHDHLATLPPPGTQAERHHMLLAHLRSKAEKSLARRKHPRNSVSTLQTPRPPMASRKNTGSLSNDNQNLISIPNYNDIVTSPSAGRHQSMQNNGTNNDTALFAPQLEQQMESDGMNDMSMFSTMLTPNSNSDSSFQYMLDFGWESLDTIGANVRGMENYNFGMI